MNKSPKSITPLERAIDLAGGVSKLASILKVEPNVVSNWKLRKSVPADYCADIEHATAGAVTRYELRPRTFGQDPSHHATSKRAA